VARERIETRAEEEDETEETNTETEEEPTGRGGDSQDTTDEETKIDMEEDTGESPKTQEEALETNPRPTTHITDPPLEGEKKGATRYTSEGETNST